MKFRGRNRAIKFWKDKYQKKATVLYLKLQTSKMLTQHSPTVPNHKPVKHNHPTRPTAGF
jgi:hypothetical protein